MAEIKCCRPHLLGLSGKKRLVAEATLTAIRAWNDAKAIEKCPREESFPELYAVIGDSEAQKAIREETSDKRHCRWLKQDSNACMCLPKGLSGAENEAGNVCPNNIYESSPEVFVARDAYLGDIERLFRLVSQSELGMLRESDLDSVDITELITAKGELDRNSQQEREQERVRSETERRDKEKASQIPHSIEQE